MPDDAPTGEQVYTLQFIVSPTDEWGIDEIALTACADGSGDVGLGLATGRFPTIQDRCIAFRELLADAVRAGEQGS